MLSPKQMTKVVRAVERNCDRFEKDELMPYLERLHAQKVGSSEKVNSNIALQRYVGISSNGMEAMRFSKGVSTKVGKTLIQPMLQDIAGIAGGNSVMAGSGAVDFMISRNYGSQADANAVLTSAGIPLLGNVPNNNRRLYLVSVKATDSTQSGSTVPGAVDKMYAELASRRKEGEVDVVALFLNMYGTKNREFPHKKSGNAYIRCFELSGDATMQFLTGDRRVAGVVDATLKSHTVSPAIKHLIESL